MKILVLKLDGSQLAELQAEPSWKGADMRAALKEHLQPGEWVHQMVCGSDLIRDCQTLQELGLASGSVVSATIVSEVCILLPNGAQIKTPPEGTVGTLKERLATHDLVCPAGDSKTLELVCDGHVLDDDEPLLSLSGRGGLALRVVRALYSLNAYCASLHAQRTAAPETMNGFRAGSWPRFSNHCMECQQPLHWVSGDSSGGGRHRAGTFFCQGCMLTFHVDELND